MNSEWQEGDRARIRNYLQLPPERIAEIQLRMESVARFDVETGSDIVGEVQAALTELDTIAAGETAGMSVEGNIISQSISVQGEFSKSISYDMRYSAYSKTNRRQSDLINKIVRDLGIMQQLSNLYRS